MKFILMLASLVICVSTAYATPENTLSPSHCQKGDAPTIIKPMENWDIIATNTGTIDVATVFSGKQITYSISTHPKNHKNKVTINKKTGVIKVIAEKKDNFDITVKAKNACGSASNKFNVIIDEET